MSRPMMSILLLSALFLLPMGRARAEEGRGYLSVDGGYKTGDFGTTTRSNLYYLSPTLGYVAERYDASITVPFLSLGTGGMHGSETGVGDIILRGGRVLVPERESGISLDGSLAVKLPTADEAKGLGTGETDYGAFLGLHQRLGAYKISLLAGYIKVGDPPFLDYNDISLYGIGLSRIFASTEVYASFEGRKSMVRGAQDPREINAGFFHALNADYAVRGGVFGGLNDGGPDLGLNMGLIRWF